VSPDNRLLLYLRLASADGAQDLLQLPVKGGREEKLLSFVDAFAVNRDGIALKYYQPGVMGPDLRFYRFDTRATTRLAAADRPLRYGIALSPDGRYLRFSQADYEVTDLKLADIF
jgi:hypothetical protein